MATKMGSKLGFSNEQLANLAGTAVMHDNALTEYIAVKKSSDKIDDVPMDILTAHCIMGERNIESLSFFPHKKNAVKYHHENADGSGPFHLSPSDTPIEAQLIHLADQIDIRFKLGKVNEERYQDILRWLRSQKHILFSSDAVDLFEQAVSYADLLQIEGDQASSILVSTLSGIPVDYSREDVIALGSLFAKIVDFKSHFTCDHSIGIARKAEMMGKYYDESPETCMKLYLAGALHDVGKLKTPPEILEKPDKLTPEEYEIMKEHAYYSWVILKDLDNIPDVVSWACLHHEKLDGSGYPFKKTAAELNKYERLLACIDIYQALTEKRPYKNGLTHDASINIMRHMAENGKIDPDITEDIGHCFSPQTEA